jgi:Fe2+ or Zn2+ uptake regulation protein
MKQQRDFIYCLDKNCDGYKGGLWIDKLKRDKTHHAFICSDCGKLIPAMNINIERNLSIKENKNNGYIIYDNRKMYLW